MRKKIIKNIIIIMSMLFFTKYLFRTLHIGSFAIVFGNLVLDNYFGERSLLIKNESKKRYTLFYVISCITLIISGIINLIILIKDNKYEKNLAYMVWKKLLIGKVFLSLFLTPLLELLLPAQYFLSREDYANGVKPILHFKIRMVMTLVIFLISPFLRYYREYYMKIINVENVKLD